ncbi:hypothetical protein YC2023_042677 [Brassica napus]|uniref:(rape) hypothetical protein n=1 Tax=Brassica napus TaxID=3708 RepID=A0A816INW9_BRANA|nr:unnamed protein product [Brassica napus]
MEQIEKDAYLESRSGELSESGFRSLWRQNDFEFVGTSLNTIKRTVKFLFPAEIIPPYIEVNLSLLDVGQKLVAGDLKVHLALRLIRPKDEPIVKIAGGRVSDQQKKDQPKKDQPKK